jgi:spermidine synthase
VIVPAVPAVVVAANDTADVDDVGGAVDTPRTRVLFHERSPLQDVWVVEEDGERLLRFDRVDGNDQSALDPVDPHRLVFEYVRLATLGTLLAPASSTTTSMPPLPTTAAAPTAATPTNTEAAPTAAAPHQHFPSRALVIGLGGGAFPAWLVRQDPVIRVDVAEIDPVVVDVARRFFALPATPRLAVHTVDGAVFVARARAGYDLVLLDAFSGDGIPRALSTPAFFADVRRVLADDGVVMLNIALVTRDDAEGIARRFTHAFPGCVRVHSRREDNLVLLGARRPLSTTAVEQAVARAPALRGVDVAADIGTIRPCR